MSGIVGEPTRSAPAEPRTFTRQATGLVREGKTSDALYYNIMWGGFALVFMFYYLGMGSNPGSNWLIAVLIAALLGLPGAFLYAMLIRVMPRTGGDYVFISRAVSPVLGFTANFAYMLAITEAFGIYCTFFVHYGAAAFFRVLAGYSGNTGLLSVGNWFTGHWGTFITGIALLFGSAFIFVLGGTRFFFKYNRVCFYTYVVGVFLIPVLVGIFTSHASFLSSFNSYASHLGTHHAVSKALAAGRAGGYAGWAFSLKQTILAVTVAWFIFGFVYASNYFGGEIRLGKSTHLRSIVGALLITVVGFVVLVPLFQHMVGINLLGSISVGNPAAYGFAGGPPGFPELVAIGAGSPVLAVIVILGFVAGIVVWLPQTMLIVSRCMLAWSFDGVMPAKLGEVDPRTHTPLWSTGVVVLLAIIATAIFSFTSWLTAFVGLFPQTLTLMAAALAGIVLPFRLKHVFEASPVNQRWLGIPVLSIVGALSFVGFTAANVIILIDPASGTSINHNLKILLICVAIFFVVGPAIYFAAKFIRARQGIDLGLVYGEIPPE